MIQKLKSMSLYQKFALAIVLLGLFPILVIFPVVIGKVTQSSADSIQANYLQAANYVASSAENVLITYDNASKLIYQYGGLQSAENQFTAYENYQNYDRIRQFLTEEETARQSDMRAFLRAVSDVDTYIYAVHFIADSEEIGNQQYHYSAYSTYFEDEKVFYERTKLDALDRATKNAILIMPHEADYFSGTDRTVFTLARNYFDLRGAVGKEKYIGTILIDIDIEKLRTIFKSMQLGSEASYALIDEEDICLFATTESLIGQRDGLEQDTSRSEVLQFSSPKNRYGIRAVVQASAAIAYAPVRSFRTLMLWMVVLVTAVLLVGALIFSKHLTGPIGDIVQEMKKIETGDFDIHLPVRSRDEIGVLSERFNEMSRELEKYINQSYVARLRQNEAELTALKSQIYPHFLYNTLEVIRMSALENEDGSVADMIEALSEQIHYLIGPMEDMVPLETEIDIVRKYVYLLNCRITGKVTLNVDIPEDRQIIVPKLLLQPIVENAYVHGIKPKNGSGSILIEAVVQEGRLLISVFDNGVGIDEAGIAGIHELLAGDRPGIKSEYNWQSIGLKNVHDRVRLLYGPEYGIAVSGTPGVGTVVQITMPDMQ